MDMLTLDEGRVMFRWHSSLWKLLWRELLVYTISFLAISCVYRFALTGEQQASFELLVRWSGEMYTGLPITFLLGFYVSLVVKRWWEQYCKLPWPDNIAIFLKGLVAGDSALIIRRTVIRYCMLSYILCIRRLSVRLRKRFPTMQEIIRVGLIRPDEALRVGEENSTRMYGSNWRMPLKWSAEILVKAQEDGLIKSAPGFHGLLGQVAKFQSGLCEVATYGHIPVPLVYTQVVTLAVYFYFGVSLIGEQWLLDDEVDLYYPIFMTIKFLFLFGWLRVAETLYNPFGEDDEDFELNELLNRHFRVAMNIVEDKDNPPELRKDVFWGQEQPELIELGDLDMNLENNSDSEEDNKDETIEGVYTTNQEKRDPML